MARHPRRSGELRRHVARPGRRRGRKPRHQPRTSGHDNLRPRDHRPLRGHSTRGTDCSTGPGVRSATGLTCRLGSGCAALVSEAVHTRCACGSDGGGATVTQNTAPKSFLLSRLVPGSDTDLGHRHRHTPFAPQQLPVLKSRDGRRSARMISNGSLYPLEPADNTFCVGAPRLSRSRRRRRTHHGRGWRVRYSPSPTEAHRGRRECRRAGCIYRTEHPSAN